MGAVVTIKAVGLPRSGRRQGDGHRHRHGQRRAAHHSAELKPLGEPGAYALSQQWPKEGKWVIQLVGKNDEQFTNTLVAAGPAGVDRLHAKGDMKAFAPADVDADAESSLVQRAMMQLMLMSSDRARARATRTR